MILSILIPTVTERAAQFEELRAYLEHQIATYKLTDQVEILHICDNKEVSVGVKRDQLYRMAKGKYSVMWDDDDWIAHNGLSLIAKALQEGPDCVGYKELCIFDGKRVASSSFSLLYHEWGNNQDGFDHVRTPFFKTPIRTDLCCRVGVMDIRFAEDHDFARRIKPLLKTEIFINEFIYIYRHNSSPFNQRYGIAQ